MSELTGWIKVTAFSDLIVLTHDEPWVPRLVERHGSDSADNTLRRVGLVRVTQWTYPSNAKPYCFAKIHSALSKALADSEKRAEVSVTDPHGQLALRDTVAQILLNHGAGPGDSIHDVPCTDPQRPDDCRCVQDLAEEIVKELSDDGW